MTAYYRRMIDQFITFITAGNETKSPWRPIACFQVADRRLTRTWRVAGETKQRRAGKGLKPYPGLITAPFASTTLSPEPSTPAPTAQLASSFLCFEIRPLGSI